MLALPATLHAWDTPGFAAALKAELAAQGASLPLQQALAASSAVSGEAIEPMVLDASIDAGGFLRIKVGIFFSGIVAGCSCADDPTPVDAQPEYCELLLAIDPATATTDITLLSAD